MQKQIRKIIDQCLSISHEIENSYLLSFYFDRFAKKESISRITKLDQTIFLRMYGRIPSSSETLKIRYWRCGHHLPANRIEMIRLGFALCLTPEELNQLLTILLLEPALYCLDCREFIYHTLLSSDFQYTYPEAEEIADFYTNLYHRYRKKSEHTLRNSLKEQISTMSATRFPSPPPIALPPSLITVKVAYTENWKQEADIWIQQHHDYFDHAYETQNLILRSLCRRYLMQIPQSRLDLLNVSSHHRFHNLRHIFYCDILDCLWHPNFEKKDYYKNHTYSLDFSSEMNRYFKHGAKLTRITLIRLLLVFTMPDTDVTVLNDLLKLFGYAPLSENIRTISGACQDTLIIRILELYEIYRSGNEEKDRAQLISIFCLSDKYLNELLNEFSVAEKGSILYKKRQRIKDLKIMTFHSLRKEIY